MSNPNDTDRTEAQQEMADGIRRSLAAGFAFVRSMETNLGLSSLTLEAAMQEAITDIETDNSDLRPGKLSRVRQVREQLDLVVEQALKLPDGFFSLSESSPANTTREGSGPASAFDDAESE